MNEQGLLNALHGIQLWGIVGQSVYPSLGKIRCGSNDEYLEAYRALEGEVGSIITENAKLRELAVRFADYVGQDRCEGCVTKTRCNEGLIDECWLLTEIREIADEMGIEVR